jgi:hypothetical protein
MRQVTVCKCGLAKCYHEGTHDIATKPTQSLHLLLRIGGIVIYQLKDDKPPVCTGYRPRIAVTPH